MDETWDCIVVGGGAAGLSAALVLGRARRRTLVVDAGRQSNLAAHGIGGLLGWDQRPPSELYEQGHRELARYPGVEVRRGEVVDGWRSADGDGLALVLDDGAVERTRRVILATGMDYRPVEVTGVAERWGRSVFHCPFCHGWEVRERTLGVLDGSAFGAHRALLLRTWSDNVTLYTNGGDGPPAEELEQLAAAGVGVEPAVVERLEGPGDELSGIVLADGTDRSCHGLLVATTLHQRSDLAARLGAEAAAENPLAVDGLVVDAMAQTTAPDVLAAGDLASSAPSVAAAVAAGSWAAAGVVRSLVSGTVPAARTGP